MTVTAAVEECKVERRTESVFRPAMLLMSGRVLAFGATFFIPVVLARTFDQTDFGTYKQLFLIFTTAYLVAQVGMASSLYYFLPLAPRLSGRYAANAVLCLAATGGVCGVILIAGRARLSEWLSNSELGRFLPWIGAYLALMMIATALEIVLVARGRYLWASASYAISDVARGLALIIPAILFHRLEWVLAGAVAIAGMRTVATLYYFYLEFGAFRPDPALLKEQLRYAFPFALAILIEILQSNYHQYVISHRFDPATFAIYAVGCLQVPFVDFVANPTSDVMMVRMQEELAGGHPESVLSIWHDTTRKLALLFFPLVGLLVSAGREIILFLFTKRYEASIPVFLLWSTMILLAAFQVDGVLRVYAETGFLLFMNLLRLAIIGVFIGQCLTTFHLLGAVLVTVVAAAVGKTVALVRILKLLRTSVTALLPWRGLGAAGIASLAAMLAALAIKSQIHASAVVRLAAVTITYSAVYAVVLWRCEILSHDEKSALIGVVRNTALAAARALA